MNNNTALYLAVILALFAAIASPWAYGQATADIANEVASLESDAAATGQDWFDLASKARRSSEFELAQKSLDIADEKGVPPIRIGLERSRILIDRGDPQRAVEELNAILDAGFTSVGFITADSVINSLAGRDDYDDLIRRMAVQAYPCAHQDGFKDFDFWVGSWTVRTANGTVAGSNVIQRAERGCVLIENWRNTTGGTGMSINYLDKVTDEWVQIWNAEGGSQINIRGGLTDEGMRMEGHIHNVASGTTSPFRALWTLLPDGRVRQFFEQSNDSGETWSPWFEGFYTRIN